MARRVFYSFHYDADNWRVSQIRNIGLIEGNRPATDNDWEVVKRRGDTAIKKWIDSQLDERSCTVVLIGTNTAGRKWINYEIKSTWNQGKGLVGIHIHGLLDKNGQSSQKGSNPFSGFTISNNKKSQLSSIVKCYDPAGYKSTDIYASISANISGWIEEAIRIR
jgi:hypothetical protein